MGSRLNQPQPKRELIRNDFVGVRRHAVEGTRKNHRCDGDPDREDPIRDESVLQPELVARNRALVGVRDAKGENGTVGAFGLIEKGGGCRKLDVEVDSTRKKASNLRRR